MSRKSKKEFSAGFWRLFESKAGKRVFPRAMKNEMQFEDDLPFVTLQHDDKTILTRGGELMQCIRMDGLNAMTASDGDIDGLKNRIATIIAQSGQGHSFYVHKISRPFKPKLKPISGNGFAHDIEAKWTQHLSQQNLRDRTLTITVLNRPARLIQKAISGVDMVRKALTSSSISNADSFADDKQERISELDDLIRNILSATAAMNGRILTGNSGELIGFLEAIGTGVELPAYPNPEIAILARSVANHRPTFQGTKLFLSGGVVANRIGQIFTIKNYPRQANAGMFDELSLSTDMVITHSFVPESEDRVNELIRRTIRQRINIDDSGHTDRALLTDGLDRLASGIETFGYHHMTVAIYAKDEEALATASAELRQIAQESGTKLITEAFAGQGHYFAQWPGNATYRARTSLMGRRAERNGIPS